jgi:integrase/recombinase XerD
MKTLDQLLEDSLEYDRSVQLSPATLQSLRAFRKGFVEWLKNTYGVTTADQLRLSHLESWQKYLPAKLTGKGLPIVARTINRYIAASRSLLKYLVRHGYAPPSFTDALAYVKEPVVLPTSVLTHAQVRRMLARIPTTRSIGYRNRVMLELLYSTGLRASELVRLNVADVDLVNASVRVWGKGNRERLVPIGRTALRLLESYLRAVRPYLLRDPAEPAMFIARGKRLPYTSVLRVVHQYADKLGLDVTVTPHTFRRSYTTELIRNGANVYHVKELLGHQDLHTLKHYARLNIGDLQQTHARCHPREREDLADGHQTDDRPAGG